MNICIFVPGSVTNGIYSAGRGEARWALNWASFLSDLGFNVDCIANPGIAQPHETKQNIKFLINENLDKQYDVYLDSCWYQGKQVNTKAKLYVHLCYGFEKYLIDEFKDKKNHFLAYPYARSVPNFFHDANEIKDRTIFLPIPLAPVFGKSGFKNNILTYSAKEVFLDRLYPEQTHWFEAGKNTIQAIVDIAKENSFECYYMMHSQLKCAQCARATEEYGIFDIINSYPSTAFMDEAPYNKVMNLVKRSKMVFPVISPGGSMIDAVSVGVLPLTWSGSVFNEEAIRFNWMLRHDSSYQDIYNNISMVIKNEELYNKILASYQEALKDHLFLNCKNYFLELLKKI